MTTATKNPGVRKSVSAKWRKLLVLLPGYDPFRDAGECWFDEAEADRVVEFFETMLTHIEGELAGKPFILEPWQKGFIGNLFGWKRPDETRRYREGLLYVPRKNGKSPLIAGVADFVLFGDDEASSQNYCAAADREQAALLFRYAKGMVEQEPCLMESAQIYGGIGQRSIVNTIDQSFLKVISADAGTKHGFTSHLAIVDELHVQPNRDLVDVLMTSQASANRRQPLMLFVTTADFQRESICNEKYEYACKVRDGVIADPYFLPCVYEALPDDDWTDERVWAKANPNLGVSVSMEYLRRECARAKETPAYENTFKRLHLNMRTEQDVRWLPIDKWDACGGAPILTGTAGWYAGLDLSSKVDISAYVEVRESGGVYDVLPLFWMPADTARDREREDRVPYSLWARQGFITLTEGNVVDYERIIADLQQRAKSKRILDIAYDAWNATHLATRMMDGGAKMTEFGQGYKSMSEPMKTAEALVLSGKIRHGGHPVLRWMVSNVAVELDPAGNLKPSKKKSTGRIDGVVAMFMALGRAIVQPHKTSVYATRGVITA